MMRSVSYSKVNKYTLIDYVFAGYKQKNYWLLRLLKLLTDFHQYQKISTGF